jgi:hypothetical protein
LSVEESVPPPPGDTERFEELADKSSRAGSSDLGGRRLRALP